MYIKTVIVEVEINYTGKVDTIALERAIENGIDTYINDHITEFQYEDHVVEAWNQR
jgi:hypothetical protein